MPYGWLRRFLNDAGVVTVTGMYLLAVGIVSFTRKYTDFLPRQVNGEASLFWLVRRVEVCMQILVVNYHFPLTLLARLKVVRGIAPLRMECAPAFNYARDSHTTEFVPDSSVEYRSQNKVIFRSPDLELDLRYVAETTLDNVLTPQVNIDYVDLTSKGHLGPSVCCDFSLVEGQRVTFVLRICPDKRTSPEPKPTQELADRLGVPLERRFSGYQMSELYLIRNSTQRGSVKVEAKG